MFNKRKSNFLKLIVLFQFLLVMLVCQGQPNPEKHAKGMSRLSFLNYPWNSIFYKRLKDGSFEKIPTQPNTKIDSSLLTIFKPIFKGNYYHLEAKLQNNFFSMTIGYDQWRDKYVMVCFEDGPGLVDIYQGNFETNGDLVLSNYEAGTHYVHKGIKYYNRMVFTNFSPNGFTWYIDGSTDGSNWIKFSRYDLIK